MGGHGCLSRDGMEVVKIATSRTQGRNAGRGRESGPRVNRDITGYRACRLIGSDGNQLGMFDIRDAYNLAQEEGLDLVEMSAEANPPVCKIMDYSKYRYEQQKRAKANKRKSQETKQMKFRCKISDGDYATKRRHIIRFLEDGNKVRVVIMFRGREMSHTEIGETILNRLLEDLDGIATVTQKPLMDGRDMSMVLSPTQETLGRGIQRKTENADAEEQRRKERQARGQRHNQEQEA